jgi:hypothetical protein
MSESAVVERAAGSTIVTSEKQCSLSIMKP